MSADDKVTRRNQSLSVAALVLASAQLILYIVAAATIEGSELLPVLLWAIEVPIWFAALGFGTAAFATRKTRWRGIICFVLLAAPIFDLVAAGWLYR